METLIDELVNNEEKKLQSKGFWTNVVRLKFQAPQYPYCWLEYGNIHSNGMHESKIGTLSIFKDGCVIKINHL